MKIYVEKVRIEKGFTMLELSKMSGVAISHIHNIENGNKVPIVTILCKLARVLNVHFKDHAFLRKAPTRNETNPPSFAINIKFKNFMI